MTKSKPVHIPLDLRMSGSALKVIAIISMVIDHWALYFMETGMPLYEAMRCFGRIAFPVFAFLTAGLCLLQRPDVVLHQAIGFCLHQ